MTTQIHHPQADRQPPECMTVIPLDGERRLFEDIVNREVEGLPEDLAQTHLVLDFGDVPYIASTELGSLVALHKSMRASGGKLTLTNVAPQVFEIFVITKLDTVMDVRVAKAS